MKRWMLVGGLVSALAGCASTPGGLAQPENEITFEVPMGYQEVLRNIAAGTRECAPVQLLPLGQQINDVQHYPDMRQGRITMGASGVGTQIYQVIDVLETQPGRTKVSVFAKNGRARDTFSARARRWAEGDMACTA